MELSKRLSVVAGAVTPGNRVADIGTDHGYVPIYLLKKGNCPFAIAMDVNRGPLERAKEHIQKEGLSDVIQTRLSNGLEKLHPGEVDTIVIAGMGGDLICRILSAAPQVLKHCRELILQPQSEWFKVRHFLHAHGYKIEKEWFLKEDGKYYVILRAQAVKKEGSGDENTRKTLSYEDEFSYEYGRYLLDERNPVLLEYLKKEAEKKENIASAMEKTLEENDSPSEEKRKQRICQLKKEAADIRQALNEMEI